MQIAAVEKRPNLSDEIRLQIPKVLDKLECKWVQRIAEISKAVVLDEVEDGCRELKKIKGAISTKANNRMGAKHVGLYREIRN